jgi:hypothetical protein
MLEWVKANNKFYGYDDGDLLYRVFNDGTGHGWDWEDVPEWEGEDGYETAEAAMAAAEAHYAERLKMEEEILEELELDLEDIDAILAEMLYEEAKTEGWLK